MTRADATLTAADWTRVQELFHELADHPRAEQLKQLDLIAAREPQLAQKVQELLVADAEGDSVLDAGVAQMANEVLRPEAGLPPVRFGPYKLVRLLGEGGMGVVYLGHRADLDSFAAIKILANAWISPTRRERFLAETQTLAALSHPSIARLFDADHLPDGTPWFAMEYVEGEPITKWVWQRRLALRDTLRLFVRLCDAVQHAHERAVIHRDLKPSNVLVTADGTVKLLDFGIAKRFRDPSGVEASTRTTSRALTPAYAAPEQLRGGVAGARADVYALGIILFELITGSRPYDLSDLESTDPETTIRSAYPPRLRHALSAKAREHPATDTHSLHTGEWADLDALLSAAMAPEPDDRYRSVEALRRDVERFLDHQPLEARNAGWVYRARKLMRRRWREVTLGTAVTVASVVGLVLHNRELAAARDVAVAEAARTNRLKEFLENMFQGGPQPAGPVDSIRVATLVENGIREASALSTDPVAQVDLLGTLGIMSERMSNYARADSLYLLEVAQAERLYGPNDPAVLRARVQHARVLAQLGKVDSAEHQLRTLDSLARQQAAARHPVIAEVNTALGTLLREHGKPADAIPYLARAVDQRRQADTNSREYIDALRELGNAFGNTGDLARADSMFRLALPIARRLFGPKHPEVGFLLSNLGNTASQRGRLEEAERYQREGVAINVGWYGADHYLTAAASGVLAQTLIRMKRFDDAIPVIRRAIDIFARTKEFGPMGANTSIARSSLGLALSGRGDHEAARQVLDSALVGLRATLGDKNSNTLTVESNLAVEMTLEGHPDSAIAVLTQVEKRGLAAYGEQSVPVANIRAKLGDAFFKAKRYPDAIATINAALAVLDQKLKGPAPLIVSSRQDLIAAYAAVGDTVSAARVRRRLADTLSR